MSNPRDMIEQAARQPDLDTDGHGKASRRVYEGEVKLSQAISLKRIADALEAGVIEVQQRKGH